MALTPADVHNVAFSRARIGKRGYNEQEVDLFIDLVEQELTRYIEDDAARRDARGGSPEREAAFREREAKFAQQHAELREAEGRIRAHGVRLREVEDQLRQKQAHFAQVEAQLAKRGIPLVQQVAQLRHRESQIARRETQFAEKEADVVEREAALAAHQARLTAREGELRKLEAKLKQQQGQVSEPTSLVRRQRAELRQRPYPPEPVGAYLGTEDHRKPHPVQARVNGVAHHEEVRTVAGVQGRHDMERMAVRAVTDMLGNTVTETVHERTRRSEIGHRTAGADQSGELEQLREANAELARANGLLKAATALLAAALDPTQSLDVASR